MRTTGWKVAAAILTLGASWLTVGCQDDAFCFNCEPGGGTDASVADSSDKDQQSQQDVAHEEAAACPDGFGDCNGINFDGCEVNLSTSKSNCGACGNICALANADAVCVDGKCVVKACEAGFKDCDSDSSNGCESDVGSDPENCGKCGSKCDAVTHGKPTCQLGKCNGFSCDDGFADCDTNVEGCETDLNADANNCGQCGRICDAMPHAAAACVNGTCGVGKCEDGMDDCDKSVWSGCESILATDVDNCGACGNKCPDAPNGAAGCKDSKCTVGACNPGYDNCDETKPGCESYLATDVNNCGACKNKCPDIANGTPGCAKFQCGISSCTAPWGDCFGGAADGCETNLDDEVDHCGTCSTKCPAVAHGKRGCSKGKCEIASCTTGWQDCDGKLATGCETDVTSDTSHCGKCSTVCPTPTNGTAECVDGTCGIKDCSTGYSNCDGKDSNGCEQDTSSDVNNCGGCGVKCPSESNGCSASTCQCSKKVLLLKDDSASGATTLKTAIEGAGLGLTVTISTAKSYQYNGTNPSLSGFGSVVVLAGGPGTTASSTDMPKAGQDAIVTFAGKSNGVVFTEWAAQQVAQGRWKTLAPLVLLNRTVAYSGQVTYTVEPSFKGSPLWNGLSDTFTFASVSNVGLLKVGPGVTRVASSTEALDAVAIRDLPDTGRIVHIAHAGNYSPNGWNNANIQRVVANAAYWAARCQ